MAPGTIAENYRRIRQALPAEVAIAVAAKGRTAAELAEVIEAGASIVGENYVQEGQKHVAALGDAATRAEWHLIGHLQRNKVRPALELFNCMQTLDSLRLAQAIDERASAPVRAYIEVNVGGEQTKGGVPPDEVLRLAQQVAGLANIRLEGLMTIEPLVEDPNDARPCFQHMRRLFEALKGLRDPSIRMSVLSMGMTDCYRVAVEEGANMVRIGTAIFGPRGA
jgi:hypothetical protein